MNISCSLKILAFLLVKCRHTFQRLRVKAGETWLGSLQVFERSQGRENLQEITYVPAYYTRDQGPMIPTAELTVLVSRSDSFTTEHTSYQVSPCPFLFERYSWLHPTDGRRICPLFL